VAADFMLLGPVQWQHWCVFVNSKSATGSTVGGGCESGESAATSVSDVEPVHVTGQPHASNALIFRIPRVGPTEATERVRTGEAKVRAEYPPNRHEWRG
jgi:hypothetical protein